MGRLVVLGTLLACCWVRIDAFTGPKLPLRQNLRLSSTTPATSAKPSKEYTARKDELKKVLYREYTSFFVPFEKSYYKPDVKFMDPLNSLEGADKYTGNVDMLGGRTLLGRILFSNAKINLHSITEPAPNMLRTRWTLSFAFKALPWKPVARFTGISDYTLDADGLVVQQQDYWDSINLKGGSYEKAPKSVGLKDFAAQLLPGAEATGAMSGELPFELLRRAGTYEVRRYPSRVVARTAYTTRPEGYDRLGSFASGSNADKRKLEPLAPSIIRVPATGSEGGEADGRKTMEWPVAVRYPNGELVPDEVPEPAVSSIVLTEEGPIVVGVLRFSDPTTEQFVGYYNRVLKEALKADGLTAAPETTGSYTVAQYNAIFSLATRRNEVWVPLESHDWE